MSNYYAPQQPAYGGGGAGGAQNLNFYESTFAPPQPGGTPQGGFGYGAQQNAQFGAAPQGFGGGFGGAPGGVSGRMGEQGGLRTGWLAAFSTEGYEGEPPLLEELGVNFGHIGAKVGSLCSAGNVRG